MSLERLVGQTILTSMPGPVPTAAFMSRIQRGEVGGVVLYSDNYGSAGPRKLIAQLQSAARSGGSPPLLVSIDQEGGIVKRLPGAPTLAPPQMTSPVVARRQGQETGRNLRQYGINVDLAPVLDLGHGGFITPRTFGSTPAEVATRGVAFLLGLRSTGVLPTAKHFPGLGYATQTTDNARIVVQASRAELLADLAPYRTAIAAGLPLIMVSTASYPGLGVSEPAAASPAIVSRLLRGAFRFHGVVMTDALATPATSPYGTVPEVATRAIGAGVDMVLVSGGTGSDPEGVSTATYGALLAAAGDGRIPRKTLESSYARILALKRLF